MKQGWLDAHHAVIAGHRRGIGPALIRAALALASIPYAMTMRLRNRLYDWGWKRVHRVSTPVVSVGNLSVGGTGKTPAVEWLARFVRRADRRVAILSRGYGQTEGRNDEALVLEANLPDVPHLQGKDRVALAHAAVEELESELLILDDGFQHRRLHRDLDIVLIDATNPWGYGWVLPRGLLREPKGRLKQADAVVLTRCDQIEEESKQRTVREIHALAPTRLVLESVHQPRCLLRADGTEADLHQLQGRAAAAFCGIGNPGAFFATLRELGCDLVAERTYPDHHPYSRDDVAQLEDWAKQFPPDFLVLTTQKDLVKLRISQLGPKELWALRIDWQITAGEEQLCKLLQALLKNRAAPPVPATEGVQGRSEHAPRE